MAEEESCSPLTEAALQRSCGMLYSTHALEATCGMFMFFFFGVIAIKLHVRSHLRSPVSAFAKFAFHHAYNFVDEFLTTLFTVCSMDTMPLEVRLRFCGNLDKMANCVSALLSLLGITRWLSLGNVNGMRYVGYAMTCPLTQLELVVMLAPFVPCYRLAAFVNFSVTLLTLSIGYVASLIWMPLWYGDAQTFFQTWDFSDLEPTNKLWVVTPAFLGISILSLVTLPYLVLVWKCHGGNMNEDLPQQYGLLVFLVWSTWLMFPVWWMFSWEGMTVITDTKVNEIGFTILNMAAKGLFTLQGFRVGTMHEERLAARRGGNINNATKKGGSKRSGNNMLEAAPTANWSEEGSHVPVIISRASSRALSSSKFVQVLRAFDESSDEDDSDSDEEEPYRDMPAGGHYGRSV